MCNNDRIKPFHLYCIHVPIMTISTILISFRVCLINLQTANCGFMFTSMSTYRGFSVYNPANSEVMFNAPHITTAGVFFPHVNVFPEQNCLRDGHDERKGFDPLVTLAEFCSHHDNHLRIHIEIGKIGPISSVLCPNRSQAVLL
uniref:Uncharacterized protein n=1 Tax=Glossina pallidipes TaxID=7398 RepID=A0A1B0AD63_GLOPL